MSIVRSIAFAVAIVSLVFSAVLAGMYLLGIGRESSVPEMSQDGFAAVTIPAQDGQLHVDDSLIAPAEETPSFA